MKTVGWTDFHELAV